MENPQTLLTTPCEWAAIPDKRYFTIGEVAELCAVKPHVLRMWESTFTVLNPVKRRGNRRYYQLKDITIIRQIRVLIYEHRLTLEAAQAQLSVDLLQARERNTLLRHTIEALERILIDLTAE